MSAPARRHYPYHSGLAERLRTGLKRLPERFHVRHAGYILSRQNPDGGFPGRRGGSDVYYTSFALRGLDLLDAGDHPEVWRKAAQYLRHRGPSARDIVECYCIVHARHLVERRGCTVWGAQEEAAALQHLRDVFRRHRATAGGYAKIPGSSASLYHTFLAALSSELVGCPTFDSDEVAAVAHGRRCAGGGFSDVAEGSGAEEGRINPTAAASALLALGGVPDESLAKDTADFVASMQRTDGGFVAHRHAPGSDLMSTFTALVTLQEANALGDVDLASVGRFVKVLAGRHGGFRSTYPDDTADVEYTYYGLGTLGVLGLCLARRRLS